MRTKYLDVFLAFVLRKQSGATTLMFAIMFPLLLMFFSVALDGARFQTSRARLADAMNQGVLAIAVDDTCDYVADSLCNRKPENLQMLRRYLNYYLPDVTFPDADLRVIVNLNRDKLKTLTSIDYNAQGTAKSHPMFKSYREVGFNDDIYLRADSTVGSVRKNFKNKSISTDYVFVVDISSSMLEYINKLDKKYIKYELLKEVVTDFSDKILANNIKNTIGIVPFNVGVPVKLDKNNFWGGKETGCSFMGRIKKEYMQVNNKNIDLSFWYNKSFSAGANNIYKQNELVTSVYTNILRSYLKLDYNDVVSNKEWCYKYYEKNGEDILSCDADRRANVFKHRKEFDNTYDKVKHLWELMNGRSYLYLNVLNAKTIDIEETLKDSNLFSDESVTTFTYFPYHERDGLLNKMCYDHDYMLGLSELNPDGVSEQTKSVFVSYVKEIKSPPSYLIELSSDIKIIEEFKKMKAPGGDTDTSSGLLRSLPVIAKGNNPRKVIIMVTDGEDSGNAEALTNLLHDPKNNICGKIRQGLLNYRKMPKTTDAEIYYISLGREGNFDKRMKFWRDNCVGENNAFVATDYNTLMQSLLTISKENRINFVDASENNL